MWCRRTVERMTAGEEDERREKVEESRSRRSVSGSLSASCGHEEEPVHVSLSEERRRRQ